MLTECPCRDIEITGVGPLMKRLSVACIAALFLGSAGAPALAQGIGTVTSLTGEPGSVLVIRDGETFSLSDGDTLFEGDRVVTRSEGNVTLTAFGCEQSLDPEQALTIGADFCDVAPIQMADTTPPEVPPGTGNTLLVAGGAIVGIGAIAAAAGGGGGDDGGGPVSP